MVYTQSYGRDIYINVGEVKVTDFGVSAELQSTLAMCGTFVGTFKYMSPERIRNKPYSYASDIWSFGLVLMECATGIYPYTELTNCIEMAQTILECDVPELPTSQFTPELRDFIKQCLHRDAGNDCCTYYRLLHLLCSSFDDYYLT